MIKFFICLWFVCSFITIAAPLRAEDVEMVTFYPSPDGVYRNLRTTQDTSLATDAGNVGIGTSNPNFSLGLRRAAAGSSVFTQYTQDGTGATANDGLLVGVGVAEEAIFLNRENTNMIFFTNNTERLRITNAGLVGIGTTTPAHLLSVNGQLGVSTNLATGRVALNVGDTNTDYFVGAINWPNNLFANILLNGSDSTSIVFHDAGTRLDSIRSVGGRINIGENLGWGAANTIVHGNLGVANTTPEAPLHIGTSNLGLTTVTRMALEPPQHSGGAWNFRTRDDASNAFMDMGYAAGSALSIRNDGFIGIGDPTPDATLDVAGTIVSDEDNRRVQIGGDPTSPFMPPLNNRGQLNISVISQGGPDYGRIEMFDPLAAGGFQGKGNIMINGSGGNVAIGNVSPAAKLHVAVDGGSTGAISANGTIRSTSGGFVFPNGSGMVIAPTRTQFVATASNSGNNTYNLGVHGACFLTAIIPYGSNSGCEVLPSSTTLPSSTAVSWTLYQYASGCCTRCSAICLDWN